MVNNVFVIHEEVIDFFHEEYNIHTIEILSFNLSRIRSLGSMEYGKNRNDCLHDNAS